MTTGLGIIEATWASFEGFRKLGFPADDIYVIPDGGPKGRNVFVQVRQQGREFNFHVGFRGDLSGDQFAEKWRRYAAEVNAGKVSDDELERNYAKWLSQLDMPGLMLALGRKGFSIPVGGVNARATN